MTREDNPKHIKHTQNPRVEVAVGVIVRPSDGALLLAQRPAGKPCAGFWEFAGGKIEAGEDALTALSRELHEELGISVTHSQLWRSTEHDYAHARVRLHWCRVTAWTGEAVSREGQALAWAMLPLPQTLRPLLPGARPALQWLHEERGVPFDAAAYGWADAGCEAEKPSASS